MIRRPLSRFYASLRKLPYKPGSVTRTKRDSNQPPPEPEPTPPPETPKPPRYWRSSWRTIVVVNVQLLLFGHLFFTHVAEVNGPYGASMLPTLYLSGEWVVVNKMCRRGKGIQVGDVVCSRSPIMPNEGVMKRVLGMPGDFVIAGDAEGGGEMIQIPQGHCFLSGDNQAFSRDSRYYGPIPLALIRGKVVARIWPLKSVGWIENTLKPVDDG